MNDLPDQVIGEIVRLAGEGVGRNEIARRLGVSAASVTRFAPRGSFDRAATADATKARQIDMAARRTGLAADLLADAERLREQLWQPALVYAFGGKDNDYNEHTLAEPSFADKRAVISSVSTALAAHLRLVDHDTDGGTAHAESVLDQFMGAIAERAREIDGG